MKFNLKNRPKSKLLVFREIDEWFEGFEKELREMQRTACGYQQKIVQKIVCNLLEKILGE